ncbi:MAG: dienelactone hydrolase family protein [Candidatus Omnitrophica bacterium]|nr:dienelactone hydrolase family protein [Candidatus Omnitrophota bacterium]
MNRRLFTKNVLAAGGVASSLMQAAHADSLGPDPNRATHSDLGTLYEDLKNLSAQCGYPLSFLNCDYGSAADYRKTVQDKVQELLHYNPPPVDLNPEVIDRWETDAFIRETVLFNTTPWFRIPAYVLIPKQYSGKRPAIVDLHCHAGYFLFGKEKVMPMPHPHPALVEMKQRNYDGRSTSEQLARRGYVVISIDRFYFGERRTIFDDMNSLGMDLENYTVEQVRKANRRAGEGEATLAKSLFWAGTTWQGVGCWDDMRTVDYLASRSEVDPERIGCLGVSMGGDRTNYLCALDDRIQCAVSVGWMAALRPLIQSHVNTHSFSHFLPGLTHFMDLPDMIGAFAPKALMVQQCSQDQLYTLDSMREACRKIEKIYAKAGASQNYAYKFYDHPHRFSIDMQEDAFAWLDRHLTA